MITTTFDRPISTVLAAFPVPIRLKAAEKSQTPAILSPEGTTAALDVRLQADLDPSGSTSYQTVFKLVFTPSIDVEGRAHLGFVVTNMLFGGVSGNAESKDVVHDQNLDTFLSAAGIPRTDPMTGKTGRVAIAFANSGTVVDAAIHTTSVVVLTIEEDVAEGVPARMISIKGTVREGEFDWATDQGFDNPAFLHYAIFN